MKENRPAWDVMKSYINNRPINSRIKRKNILNLIYGTGQYSATSHSTVDAYRWMLTQCGVLEIFKAGEYTIKKHIREDLSASQLQKIMRGPRWKRWFIDISE